MVELLARGAQVLAALGGAYLIALWFVLIVWTYRDIQSRSNSVFTQIFSTLLVVLFFIPGVLLYLLLRPKETLDEAFQRSLEEEYLLQDLEDLPVCPSCSRQVSDEFVLCPHCQTQLREPCAGCGKLVDLKWPVCPFCALPQKERAEIALRVEPPPPRFIAPEIRKRRASAELAGAAAAAPVASGQAASLPASTQPVVRPLDRFRARPAAVKNDPAAPAPTSVGDELVRSLEERQAAQRIGAGATGSGPAPAAAPIGATGPAS